MNDPSAAPRAETAAGTSARKRRWPPPWWVQVSVSLLVVTLSVWLVLVPQLPDGERSVNALRGMSIPLAVVALLLEALSVVSYSLLTALVFTRRTSSFLTLLRIDLSGLGASHVLPAGGATSTALRVRLLHLSGATPNEALTGVAVQATASYLALGCLFVAGVVLSISSGGGLAGAGVGVITVVVLIAGTVFGAFQLSRRPDGPVRWARALGRRLPWVREEAAGAVVRGLSGRVSDLIHHPRRMSSVLLVAALHWLLDAAVLWVMLAAFGQALSVGPLLLVYGLGNILAILPLAPGGLGIVEGAMLPALVAFGVLSPAALFGVLGWRLLRFWMPIPVAALAYAWLRLGPLRLGAGAADAPHRRSC